MIESKRHLQGVPLLKHSSEFFKINHCVLIKVANFTTWVTQLICFLTSLFQVKYFWGRSYNSVTFKVKLIFFYFTAFLYLFFFSHHMQPINVSRINCLITVSKNIAFWKVSNLYILLRRFSLDYLTYIVCTS